MGALKNPRHEAFAMLVALKFMSASAAHKEVYGVKANPNVNEVNGSRLLRDAKICSRIDELHSQTIEESKAYNWSIDDKVASLKGIFDAKPDDPRVIRASDRIKAIELAARLQMQLQPPQVEQHMHFGEVDNLLLFLRSGGQAGKLMDSPNANNCSGSVSDSTQVIDVEAVVQ